MDDVLAAKDGEFGKPNEQAQGVDWWDYLEKRIEFTDILLPSLLSVQQWDLLKSLNRDALEGIHDEYGQLPRTSSQNPFIILPHKNFTNPGYVDALKSIAVILVLFIRKMN